MQTRFHPAIRVLHWTMAVLIIAMLFIGIGMVSTAGPAYALLLAWHRPIGLVILLLAFVRLSVRLATGAPELPADMPRIMKIAAKASHVLLYASMLVMPLIGWAMLSAGGYPIQITPNLVLPPILPLDGRVFGVLRLAHTWVAFAFFALILGHLTAALFHRFARRDGVFSAMTFGGRTAENAQNSPDVEGRAAYGGQPTSALAPDQVSRLR